MGKFKVDDFVRLIFAEQIHKVGKVSEIESIDVVLDDFKKV